MPYEELEEALCRLPSVEAARIVGNGKSISEVHILAAPGKGAKQVVRDVQSLAMAKFGISIDRRVVSVVQFEGELEEGGTERPAIVGIRETPEGTRSTATVTLSWRGNTYTGQSTGSSAPTARLRLIGEATLRAFEETLGSPALALEAVGMTTVGTRRVAVAQVVTMVRGDEHLLVGSALVRGSANEAVVRAVLDALNRQVPQLSR